MRLKRLWADCPWSWGAVLVAALAILALLASLFALITLLHEEAPQGGDQLLRLAKATMFAS
ncbi:hypothetical protein [Streptomyces gobiensis]|uniref:hypothetical protein n=1 Tax=Streptomyces gobiensis TaxID=2875706 RepID=UPI001E543B85|nr:hypothetical protein [Streptomyces gobiensis]UGY92731.1 hypothetical protein test1122_14045 [Streptomyces gobiensis]